MTSPKEPVLPGGGVETQSELSRLWKAHTREFTALLLALMTLAIFWPVAMHDFVNYDDDDYITANPQVLSGLKAHNVVWAFSTSHSSNWHPLTWISHMLDCQLFGQHPGAHHLVSLGFHIANTLLLFLVLRRMTGAHWRSAVVAALFAWHPLHVESVAWAAERKDVLCAFFFLLTLWAYGRYAEFNIQNAKFKRQAMGWYSAALFLFALGLMSKPMVVTLPFVLLLLDYWPLRRVSGLEFRLSSWRKLIVEKLPFLALSAASSVITFLAQRAGGAVATTYALDDRLDNAVVSCARYVGKMLWPTNLSVFYPHPGRWPGGALVAAGVFLFVVSAAVIKLARQRPYVAVGWCWYLGMLVPVIGLVQVGMQAMADRYTYLPMIGLWILLIWGAGDLLAPRAGRPVAAAAVAIVCLAACAVQCRQQVRYWRNSGTLFEHAIRVTATNCVAYINLGSHWFSQGKFDEAILQYKRALACNPADEDSLYNLGLTFFRLKQYQEAIACYEAALRVSPDRLRTHHDLAMALGEAGATDQAVHHYRLVVARDPCHAGAHNGLGTVLVKQQRLDEAAAEFRHAIRCATNLPAPRLNLALLLVEQKRPAEAIIEYREYLRLKPDDGEAQRSFADLLTQDEQVEEAIRHYREALRLKPDYAEAHCNLGHALARTGRLDEAAAHCREAVKLKPDLADAQNNLGIILAMEGKIDEAATRFREAIRLNPDHADAHSNLGNALAVKSRFDEAIREYRESLRLQPGNPAICCKLAEVLAVQGRWEEAAVHYREALRLDPENLEARNGLDRARQHILLP
jgi:tetratricopeptide (TPR) repeat protein